MRKILGNKQGLDGFFLSINKAKDLDTLFKLYQQMLNNMRSYPTFYLEKVRIFLNRLYYPTLIWEEEARDKVNNDPGNILRFKTLIGDLYDHTLGRDSSYLKWGKDEQRGK